VDYSLINITTEQTIPIRHQAMWPDKPVDFVRIPNDNEGQHFGIEMNNELVAIISLFVKNGEAQFRKFATVKKHQGKGIGSYLLNEIIERAQHKNLQRIWCNARVDKADFYHRFGLETTTQTYTKGGIDFVVMERWF